jgi:hypothetical protein
VSRSGIVAITGMHRSGTSLATRIMQIVGLSLGSEEGLAPPGRDNPAGYWENRYVTECNDEILAALGGSWDQPPVLAPGWEHDPALDPFRERVGAIVEQYYGADLAAGRLVGCKDPRLSILLPLWRTVVDIRVTVLLARSPAEVASSLHARNRMPESQAALLWLRYVLAAVEHDPGHLLLTQGAFFDDLRPTLDRITDHLDLPRADGEAEERARSHLDPELRHHRLDAAPGDDRGAPTPAGVNPLAAMADAVWARGRVDADTLPTTVRDAIVQGWIRPPIDTEALTLARAKVVELQETLRKKNRRERAQSESRPQPSTP